MTERSDLDEWNVPACGLKITSRIYGLGIRSDVPGTPNPKRLVQLQQTVPIFSLTAQNQVLANARQYLHLLLFFPKTDRG